MCTDGNPVKAPDALKAGIVDQLIEGDLLKGAVAFAREIAAKPAPKTRERNQKLGTPEQNAPIFAAARETARKKQRNLIAPLAAIDAIEAATRLPFEEGCQVEAKLFIDCLYSDQSKALIHVFFGEREVAKVPDIPKDTPTYPGQLRCGRRGRNHGRRHRHGIRQRGYSGPAQGDRSGRPRPRAGQHSQKLCHLSAARTLHPAIGG